MKKSLRYLSLLLATLTVLALLAVAVTLSVTADGDNIASDKATTVAAYSGSASGRGAKQVGNSSSYGIRMSYGAPFDKVEVSMPTWSQSDSAGSLALYKWSENGYEATVAAEPIAKAVFDPAKDNAFNALTFEEQPAGEYLVLIADTRGSIGVWFTDKTVSNGFTYLDGQEQEADWEMRVHFTKTPVVPFLPCESANAVDGSHTPPPEYAIPEDSLLNTHPVMPDTWVFTDGLGRESLTNAEVGDPREDRTLAMFYWTWHTKDMASRGYVNIADHMAKYPESKNDYDHPSWAGTGHYCFWNEPIYGFYTTEDPWVLRRHAELLANAGVDTIFTDNTNGSLTWRSSYLALYETWDDAQRNGAVNVPAVSFLLPFGANSGSKEQIETIYLDIYRQDKYQNLWFYWEEKPMLMAHNGNISTTDNLGKEILNFFTFRAGQAGYVVDKTSANWWGWLSTYPQALYSDRGEAGIRRGMIEQMTVGVACNHNYVTHEITAMSGENVMGRSYTHDYENRFEVEGKAASLQGYFFSEQFDYALEKDPRVLFVTGWNEWHAWRQPEPWGGENSKVENALVDQFDDEHSRDLEPTKGDLQDHYYYLFVNYARQYKGARPIPTPSVSATMDLSAGQEQWAAVEPYYAAYIGNTFDRNCTGYGDTVYTETSGRNDIIGSQLARDGEFLYFLVECAEDITPYTDSLWMTLYLDTDQQKQGWNTFDYVINKSAASEGTLVLEKFTADNSYASEKVADVEYAVDGRYMTVKVPKAALGLEGFDFTVNFTWTDNVHDEGDYTKFSGDILDFYISGDVAPGGRFKYSYISTSANAGVETPAETEAPATEAPATDAPVTEAPATDTPATQAPAATEGQTEEDKGGCGSALSVALPVLMLLSVGLIRRRKED